MELESQRVISKDVTEKSTHDPSLYKQRAIFYISVNGLILTGLFMDYKFFRYHYMNKIDIENRIRIGIIFVFMITYSYFKASLTSCGVSEANKYFYNNSSDDKEITYVESDCYSNCEFCNKKKFIRSSHCRTCKVCVMRRDHHCGWIANCVGAGNNRYFFIFCFWVSYGSIEFIYDAVKFYLNYDKITTEYAELKMGYFVGITLFGISFVLLSVFFGVASIVFKQIHFTFNDFTYLEKLKATFTEMHFLCWVNAQSEKRWNNVYNKGFLANFYYVLGPTIFHGLLPIPEYTKHTLLENSNLFKLSKHPHPLSVNNYLKETNYPGIKEIWEDQVKSMDPNNYLELALKNYSDKILI